MVSRWSFTVALSIAIVLTLIAVNFFTLDLLGYGGEVNTWLERQFQLTYHSPLANWANIVLILLPIILMLLYLLKLRRKPHVVASTYLWKKSIEDLHVNSLLQWLKKNVLLILQLLILACGLYAVLSPRLHGSKSSGNYYIIMLDNSASMAATDVEPNRLTWAKSEAIKVIESANDTDIGMVIVFNATAEIRQSYTTNKAILIKAVEDVQLTNLPTQIEEALSLAASLANPIRSTEDVAVRPENPEPGKERTYASTEGILADIHLYSDGRFADQPNFALANLQLNFHAPVVKTVGNTNNLAITRFDAIRDETTPSRVQTYLTVLNYRNSPANALIELDLLDGNNQVIDVRKKELVIPARVYQSAKTGEDGSKSEEKDVPGESLISLELTNVAENANLSLHARLVKTNDIFAADDQAWVVLSQIRKAQILLVTPGNILLRTILQAKDTKVICDVTEMTPDQMTDTQKYLSPIREGNFDLVIYDRCGPTREEEMPKANTVFIGYPPPPWHFEGTDDVYRIKPVKFPAIRGWTDTDPVMRGLRGWYELEIAEAYRFNNLPPKTPKLLEGDSELALMFTLQRQAHKDLVLAFPLSTSDERWNTRWFLKPVFPLFFWNVLRTMGNVRDHATEENVTPGQPVRIQPPADVSDITVLNPKGAEVELKRTSRADYLYTQTTQLGTYTAQWKKERYRFAVNLFDPNESNLEPRGSVKIGDVDIAAGAQREQLRDLWRWPILLGLGVLLLEWWVYNRRVQV